jgi:hypothetical protein
VIVVVADFLFEITKVSSFFFDPFDGTIISCSTESAADTTVVAPADWRMLEQGMPVCP